MCEHMEWNGEQWGLYNNGYWRIGGRYLHREMWALHHGPIPEGMCVHHINEVRTDNRIENLALMTRGAHAKHHVEDVLRAPEAVRKNRESLARNAVVRGKKISEAHAQRARIEKQCEHCQASMICFNSYTRWCSQHCRYKARKARSASA